MSGNTPNLVLERFKTPIGRSILKMMRERWQSDELGIFQLKGIYRIGLSEDVYRRFDLALQTNDGCPVTATYYGCIATCNIVDDEDPAACGSGSCELCDVLRSSFGNVPYGASSRDGIYGPGLYTYKNPALAHDAMISDGGQQSQDMNHALIQCRVVTQGGSGPGSKSFASFTDDAGVTFCAQSTAIIPTHLLIYTLDAPPAKRRVQGSVNADMASTSPVASAATPASGGLGQPKGSSNTGMWTSTNHPMILTNGSNTKGSGEAKSKPAKGKGKGRGKGPLPEPPRQNEPTRPLSDTSSDQQTGQGGAGSVVNQTVPTPSPTSPPGIPAPRSHSKYQPAAQDLAGLVPNAAYLGASDAFQGGPAPETVPAPRPPSPPPVPVLSPLSRGLLNPPPPVFRGAVPTAGKDPQITPLPSSPAPTPASKPGSTGPVPQDQFGTRYAELSLCSRSNWNGLQLTVVVEVAMGPDGTLQPFQAPEPATVTPNPATAAPRALTSSSPPGGWPFDSTANPGSPPSSSSSPVKARAGDDGAHGVQSSSREVSPTQPLNHPNTNGRDTAAPKESSGRSDLSPNNPPVGPRQPGSISHEKLTEVRTYLRLLYYQNQIAGTTRRLPGNRPTFRRVCLIAFCLNNSLTPQDTKLA
ncbi:hypothetical protein FRC00_003060 [Tulasnella sp. 408]|nr:hypothetical protein FRC00_003060 [Tulasnella sp. 408]